MTTPLPKHWNSADSAPAPQWWLVPNVLAWDAPLVAICWQLFFGRVFQVPIPPQATWTLGMLVWAIYIFDRLADIRTACPPTPRHQFTSRHSQFMLGMLALGITGTAVGIAFLPFYYLVIGFIMGAGVVAYLWIVHSVHGLATWMNPCKEPLVGCGFALGVALPLASSNLTPSSWVPAVAWLAMICWLNCRLIDSWENSRPVKGIELAIFLGGSLAFASLSPPPILFCGSLATVLLALVHLSSGHRNPTLARVLVDVALLTPLASW